MHKLNGVNTTDKEIEEILSTLEDGAEIIVGEGFYGFLKPTLFSRLIHFNTDSQKLILPKRKKMFFVKIVDDKEFMFKLLVADKVFIKLSYYDKR